MLLVRDVPPHLRTLSHANNSPIQTHQRQQLSRVVVNGLQWLSANEQPSLSCYGRQGAPGFVAQKHSDAQFIAFILGAGGGGEAARDSGEARPAAQTNTHTYTHTHTHTGTFMSLTR